MDLSEFALTEKKLDKLFFQDAGFRNELSSVNFRDSNIDFFIKSVCDRRVYSSGRNIQYSMEFKVMACTILMRFNISPAIFAGVIGVDMSTLADWFIKTEGKVFNCIKCMVLLQYEKILMEKLRGAVEGAIGSV